MAARQGKLSAKRIAALLRNPGRYGDGHGLILQVASPTNASWLLRYERRGRERWLGLGALHTFSLAEARERARRARQQVKDGIDPLDARRQERMALALEEARTVTFEDAAEQYYKQHESKWKNKKHQAQFLSTLKAYAYPVIGRLPVGAIDTPLVLKVIEPIWHEKTETANRVRGRIEAVLGWATVRGYRTGENPARWKGHLSEVLPARAEIQKTNHHAALPFVDLPKFVAKLREREALAARALEFTILTAARTGEIIGATWDEIDQGGKVWTIPASRMKAERDHRVPLSDRVVEILKALPHEKGNSHLFIGAEGGGLSNMAMATLLRRMGRKDFTVHGFRSTFRDWAAERTTYANHVVEMALAHAIPSGVEKAYRRGDLFEKRRKLMGAWASYIETKPSETAKVVPIGRAK